ncbi:MAG: MFS transporter [Actinomycetaceae bacterium]|nr:MFS transporter [Actinomycetaceae bacterium]MDU0969941.1 MFS transporter [Actinomycetaceae bacterium]
MSALTDHPISPTSTPSSTEARTKEARWAAASGFFGAIAEYYDFALYAPAAALLFGPLFFSPLGHAGATMASLASFGVAYIARPIGALVFGQLGDRVGRRKVMLTTLALMGIATFTIGLLPTYEAAGIVGPILLLVCRILQGLAAGIEQSGSGTLSAEHAPKKRRGFYTSWTMMGVTIGWFLGPAIMTPLMAHNDFVMAGGWRIPFLLALPIVAFAFWVRWHVTEPPVTLSAQGYHGLPVIDMLRHFPGNTLRVFLCSLHMLVGVTFNVFILGYATGQMGLSKPAILGCISFAGFTTMFTQPLFAALSDKVGRRPVFIASCLGLAACLPLVFWSLSSGSYIVIGAAMTAFYLIVMAGNVVQASFYPELFPAHVRLTGVSVSTQFGLVVVGFSPVIYSALTNAAGGAWWAGWAFAAVCWIAAAIAAWTAPETAGRKDA